mmetsp:Transcript_85094/g.197857  ORF Transcript_85094/g.197857 Transcript_85094/m.197857 type:complete len:177 (-) Transcript_85094:61-591(-)|eukprot:CAMPEP_0171076662 /NCGR_PEP_ID=MMETSP0766_2-20121228/13561_1 /TAXON_ID=439317 /ORGANISM="Gambierdiscus australes, Strain CAWD 149" /LENGTH=176 /DNA_ID=CAMNT_0011533657 /DNA_START=210 /DNA_END=740 /DNA_ORIENTATION=-
MPACDATNAASAAQRRQPRAAKDHAHDGALVGWQGSAWQSSFEASRSGAPVSRHWQSERGSSQRRAPHCLYQRSCAPPQEPAGGAVLRPPPTAGVPAAAEETASSATMRLAITAVFALEDALLRAAPHAASAVRRWRSATVASTPLATTVAQDCVDNHGLQEVVHYVGADDASAKD